MKEKVIGFKIKSDEMDKKARVRDYQNEKSKADSKKDIEEKAEELNDQLPEKEGKKAKVIITYDEKKNATPFCQILYENTEYLFDSRFVVTGSNKKGEVVVRFQYGSKQWETYKEKEKKKECKIERYITEAEYALLIRLSAFIEPHSNQLFDRKTSRFLTVNDIAEKVDKTRTSTSVLINSLINKGVLLEGSSEKIVNAQTNKKRNIKSRQLFMNPELYFNGSKDEINATIIALMRTNLIEDGKNLDILEFNGILLPFKITKVYGKQYGKVVSRRTYLNHGKV